MEYICPQCRSSDLHLGEAGYHCRACGRSYTVYSGIPDFRLKPFPYSDNEPAVLRVLNERFESLDFLGLWKLRMSFHIDGTKPPEEITRVRALQEASIKNTLENHLDSKIFSTCFARFQSIIGDSCGSRRGRALEVGCGKGTQVPDLLALFESVTAFDNSLAELILTKKFLEERGLADRVRLLAAWSEALPFAEGSFDALNMRSVLEHVYDQERTLAEMERVMAPEGILILEIPNRYSFRPEPHVKVPAVGFFPRAWAPAWVHWWTEGQVTFGGICSPSYFQLRSLMTASFGENWIHRTRLVDVTRPGVTLAGKLYRSSPLFRSIFENWVTKSFCDTHYVAAWKPRA